MWSKIEKKQLWIYIAIAYGVTALMGVLMGIGYSQGSDISLFPNAQMYYPAAGVILAYLISKKEDREMPRAFFYGFLLVTIFIAVIAIASVVFPNEIIVASMEGISIWLLLLQILIIGGSLLCWILYFVSGKGRRKAYGLTWKNAKASIFYILLFVVLYFVRTFLSYTSAGQSEFFITIMTDPITWIQLGGLLLNFFFVFTAFFGEEYGWRYFLQPLLQKKFGLRLGVIVLGVVWGLWHMPVNFFYYSPGNGLVSCAAQQITCITLGIFFAYAYMKTNNIWVPVILHYLNNNLIAVLAGGATQDILQNQSIQWSDLPMVLMINGVFLGIFLLAKPFRKKEKTEFHDMI